MSRKDTIINKKNSKKIDCFLGLKFDLLVTWKLLLSILII